MGTYWLNHTNGQRTIVDAADIGEAITTAEPVIHCAVQDGWEVTPEQIVTQMARARQDALDVTDLRA